MTLVLHVITGLDTGGAERMLTELCLREATAQDIRHIVVSLLDEGRFGASLHQAGVTVYALGMRRGTPSPAAIARLVRILRRERPDIVMTWLYAADLVGTLASMVASTKLLWNIRCSDIDLRAFSLTTRFTVRALSVLSRVPSAVATNSRAGRTAHERRGYRPKRWEYLPNGVDANAWRPDPADRDAVRAELQVGTSSTLFGMVARVDPTKDHDTLFAAAAKVARQDERAEFVLVGRGTDALAVPAELRSRVRTLGERRDVPRLMRAMDVHILSSKTEGFPNVVGEAMATGVPCIVSDVGDAADVVGSTGWVVPSGQADALAAAMLAALSEAGPALVERGRCARSRAMEHWSLDAAVARYRALWRDTLAHN